MPSAFRVAWETFKIQRLCLLTCFLRRYKGMILGNVVICVDVAISCELELGSTMQGARLNLVSGARLYSFVNNPLGRLLC